MWSLIKVIVHGKPVIGHAAGGEIVGAHAFGAGAEDFIHEFAIAMQTRSFAGRLAQTILACPALAMAVASMWSAGFGLRWFEAGWVPFEKMAAPTRG